MKTEPKNHLTLKFGRLKSWNFENIQANKLLNEYFNETYKGLAKSDLKIKKLICKLINFCDDKLIFNEFKEEYMTKKEAKNYVLTYKNI